MRAPCARRAGVNAGRQTHAEDMTKESGDDSAVVNLTVQQARLPAPCPCWRRVGLVHVKAVELQFVRSAPFRIFYLSAWQLATRHKRHSTYAQSVLPRPIFEASSRPSQCHRLCCLLPVQSFIDSLRSLHLRRSTRSLAAPCHTLPMSPTAVPEAAATSRRRCRRAQCRHLILKSRCAGKSVSCADRRHSWSAVVLSSACGSGVCGRKSGPMYPSVPRATCTTSLLVAQCTLTLAPAHASPWRAAALPDCCRTSHSCTAPTGPSSTRDRTLLRRKEEQRHDELL